MGEDIGGEAAAGEEGFRDGERRDEEKDSTEEELTMLGGLK